MNDCSYWQQVENARCELERLSSLMSVYSADFLEVSKEDFAQYAAMNHENMSVLFNLAEHLVWSADELLEAAVRGAYAQRKGEAV